MLRHFSLLPFMHLILNTQKMECSCCYSVVADSQVRLTLASV